MSSYSPTNKIRPSKVFSCSHCSCTIFILLSYSLYIQIMLILILIGVQHLQNVAFSFEKGLKGQNHSSDFHHPIKKSHQQNDPILSHLGRRDPPLPLNAIWKTLYGLVKGLEGGGDNRSTLQSNLYETTTLGTTQRCSSWIGGCFIKHL